MAEQTERQRQPAATATATATYQLDVATLSSLSRVNRHDAVKRAVLVSKAREANANNHPDTNGLRRQRVRHQARQQPQHHEHVVEACVDGGSVIMMW